MLLLSILSSLSYSWSGFEAFPMLNHREELWQMQGEIGLAPPQEIALKLPVSMTGIIFPGFD